MKVYILRHAIAEDGSGNQTDRNRRLTARGVDELRAALRGIKRLKVQPNEILASPYRRAWDTAVLAARALTPRRRPVELESLQPGASLA
ncbi:MAG: SixA phosphatase family protein, partial [Burkholderiales bacterium]